MWLNYATDHAISVIRHCNQNCFNNFFFYTCNATKNTNIDRRSVSNERSFYARKNHINSWRRFALWNWIKTEINDWKSRIPNSIRWTTVAFVVLRNVNAKYKEWKCLNGKHCELHSVVIAKNAARAFSSNSILSKCVEPFEYHARCCFNWLSIYEFVNNKMNNLWIQSFPPVDDRNHCKWFGL